MSVPKWSEIKDTIKIDVKTGRAIIPNLEYDDVEVRNVDTNKLDDCLAISHMYRRLKVVDAMNTIIRNANNEYISLGIWLSDGVADGDDGIKLYDYIGDDDFKSISQLFIDIIKDDVNDVDDLVY